MIASPSLTHNLSHTQDLPEMLRRKWELLNGLLIASYNNCSKQFTRGTLVNE